MEADSREPTVLRYMTKIGLNKRRAFSNADADSDFDWDQYADPNSPLFHPPWAGKAGA
jgi:hypothetical protein